MRIRIRIHRDDNNNPGRDLEVAGSLRRDLWAHSPVEIDPDDPDCATRRATDRTAYFEFDTEYPDEVDRIVSDLAYDKLVEVVRLPQQTGSNPPTTASGSRS